MSAELQIAGYQILKRVGTGGMATVYLAVQQSLERRAALKVMRRPLGADPDEYEKLEKRFLLEGRTLAKLPNRNIVGVYDIVKADDVAYIAMEFLDGGTLSDRMKSGLTLADAVSIVVQVASGLDFAHAQGIVHRDLKPANIMFRDAITPVLTDFGIARQTGGAEATRLTQTGMMVGTPTYMSPEQINGAEVDGRSDLYSLGILFYEMLTGAPPFGGDTPIAVLMAHLTAPLPGLPVEFDAFWPVIERMLAKNRDERYGSMREFVAALRACVVSDDDLLRRLQSDPSQSSSEQLRALGFSISQPGSGQMPRLTPRTPSPVAKLPRSTPYPGIVGGPTSPSLAPPTPAWRRPPVLAGIAVGVLFLVLAGVWLARRSGVNEAERELVGAWMKDADRLVEQNKLVAPPGDNAFEDAQKVLQREPENARALALLTQIAQTLAKEAEAALAANRIADADERAQQALAVRPGDPAIVELKARVDKARTDAERSRQVAELLDQAEAARAAGHALGSDGAYDLLRRARPLAPDDARIRKAIAAVLAAQFAPVAKSLDAGDATGAKNLLERLAPELGNEPEFGQLQTRADELGKRQALAGEVKDRVARARAALEAGHLSEPAGASAIELLQQAFQIAPDDGAVRQLRADLADALARDAQKALAAKDAPRAVDRAQLALDLVPNLASATQTKSNAEATLNAQQLALSRALGVARQALGDGRYYSPAATSASAALADALKLDPNNAEAKSLAAELPTRALASADEALKRGDLDAASRLVADVRAHGGDAAAAKALADRIDLAQRARAAEAERTQALAAASRTLDAATPSADAISAAAATIGKALAADRDDAQALALRRRLAESLATAVRASDTGARFDAALARAKSLDALLGAEPAYKKIVDDAPAARATIAAAEQARLEAERGELVLNAQPWAKVEALTDGDGKPVALPEDATTPLSLPLPAGTYRAVFRHPQAGKPVTAIARVQAKQRVVANAMFPTISAEDYLKRAGL